MQQLLSTSGCTLATSHLARCLCIMPTSLQCDGCAAAPSIATVVRLGAAQEADQSAPQRHGPYFYYSRTVEGGQYRINCRRPMPPSMGTPSGMTARLLSLLKRLTGRSALCCPNCIISMASEHRSRQ